MKIFKTLISVVLCAVVLLAGFAAAKPEAMKASADTLANYKNPFSPGGNQSFSWCISGYNKTLATTVTYSNAAMISASKTVFNGNATYSFTVNENYSGSDRTCVITVKNGSTTKKLTVKQKGRILTITPRYTGTTISANGQELTFDIASNVRFDVYTFQQGKKIGYVASYGPTIPTVSATPYTVKVSFPPNTSGATKYGLGIWVETSSVVSTKTYTQPVHTHTWGATTTTKAPTCTESGSGTQKCTVCGYSKTVTISPTNHSISQIAYKTANCKSEGYREYACMKSNCNYSYRITIPKTSHSFSLIKGSAARDVYLECANCTDYRSCATYSECISKSEGKLKDTDATQKAFIEAVCTAQGVSSVKFNNYYKALLNNAYDVYNKDSAGRVIMQALNDTANNDGVNMLVDIASLSGSEAIKNIQRGLAFYKLGYSIYELLNSSDAMQAGKNMMQCIQNSIALNPVLLLTYGPALLLVADGLSMLDKKLIENYRDVFIAIMNSGEEECEEYQKMTVQQILTNYNDLFSDDRFKNQRELYQRFLLSAKVSFLYYNKYIDETKTFAHFLQYEWENYLKRV